MRHIDLDEWEEKEGSNLAQKVISIRRVAKVVAGGRRFRFTALAVVGTGEGQVGVGAGKAQEVPVAVQKAVGRARKQGQIVPLVDGTIPFDAIGTYNSTKVIVRRAAEGTGVIAGGAARAILELAGVHNVLTKIVGSRNPYNVAKATMRALQKVHQTQKRAVLRGRQDVVLPQEAPRELQADLEEKSQEAASWE